MGVLKSAVPIVEIEKKMEKQTEKLKIGDSTVIGNTAFIKAPSSIH
jgi:hypothetical protein